MDQVHQHQAQDQPDRPRPAAPQLGEQPAAGIRSEIAVGQHHAEVLSPQVGERLGRAPDRDDLVAAGTQRGDDLLERANLLLQEQHPGQGLAAHRSPSAIARPMLTAAELGLSTKASASA